MNDLFNDLFQFGTEPHKLSRRDAVKTSRAAGNQAPRSTEPDGNKATGDFDDIPF
jgi:hypothetical protein